MCSWFKVDEGRRRLCWCIWVPQVCVCLGGKAVKPRDRESGQVPRDYGRKEVREKGED